jgi:2-oxoglutarate ferredoxin oxidoreductase subunit gamma
MLAYSAMIENKEVSWMPSYGPEMRGGTANCIVIISDTRISSPIITKFDSAILLNQPSMDKFEKAVKPNGLIIYEESTVVSKPRRDDVKYIKIAALEEATKLNKKQVANMVLLGAFLELKPLVGIETIIESIEDRTSGETSSYHSGKSRMH